MTLVTIQHNEAVKQLKDGHTYYATKIPAEQLIIPYKKLSDYLKYEFNPIFCGVVGRYVNFYGAHLYDCQVLVLDVPNTFVTLTSYYDWTDVIFYNEFNDEWNPENKEDIISFGDYEKQVFDGLNTEKEDTIIQATLPYIKPEWIKEIRNIDCKQFTDEVNLTKLVI